MKKAALLILFLFVGSIIAGWYNSAWQYRKLITIDNTGNAKTLTNYQDTVILRAANTDFSKIDEYGRDIRFTDINGTTLIDHKINAWNEAAGCTLTFEVPSITASSLDTVWMYYGYTGAINLKFGIMTDAHGITTPWARTYGTFAVQNIDTFVNRMDNFFLPNFIVGLGDWKVDVNHATDSAALFAVKTAYNALDSAHYYVMGNHDTINIGEALFCSVAGIDSARIGFDKGNYHIICIRTGATAVISAADSAWIVDNLAATSKKCLLFIHQPLDEQDSMLNFYFTGGNDLISNRANIRAKLEESGKVAAVFQGHYHWKYISNINGIPYFTITSIIEANSKKYAQATIYGDQYLVVDFKQGSGVTTDMIVWDFVNKSWVNNGDSVYLKYDDFDGGKPGWSELKGRSVGVWNIHANYGALFEYGALWNHRMLKSTFNDPDSCVFEWKYLDTMTSGSDYLGGVSSCIADSNNFRAFYSCTDGTVLWKEMTAGSWATVKSKASVFSPSTNWIKSKLIKVDSTYKFYVAGNLAYDTTKKSFTNASFGFWNYGTPLYYNDLTVRKYASPEPPVVLGGEEYDVPKCTVTVAAADGGTVSPSGAQSDTCGDTLQIIALPGAGHRFNRWERGGITLGIIDSANDTTKVWRIDSAVGTVTVTARFDTVRYVLTMACTSGTTTPSEGPHTYDSAAVVSISHTPATGYGLKTTVISAGILPNADSSACTVTATGSIAYADTVIPTTITYADTPWTLNRTVGDTNDATASNADSVTATGLPAGIACTKTGAEIGDIMGTPTTAGAGTATVIAWGPVVTDTMSLNWSVLAIIPSLDTLVVICSTTVTINDTAHSNGGDAGTWKILDSLPAGLHFASGTYSGAVTAFVGDSVVRVTCTNTGGSDTVYDTIRAYLGLPRFAYRNQAISAVQFTAITPDTPISTGGTIASYAVNSAFLDTLAFSTTTGVISGVAGIDTTYSRIITATNLSGTSKDTVSVNISSSSSNESVATKILRFYFGLGFR